MSPLVDQIEALLELNAKGAVSHPIPGLAVELLTEAAQSLRAQGGVRVTIGEGWERHSHEDKLRMQKDAGIPHLPTDLTFEARKAISGDGPRAFEWSDKKHRLVYDLCREIERLAALSSLEASPAAAGYTAEDGLRRVREIALRSEAAPLSMGEIIKVVDMALAEKTPFPDWLTADEASPAPVSDEGALAGEILAELVRARAKFPGKNVTFAALVEEVGELATATFEEGRDRVRKEAVQVAVMAMRMVLDGDHTFDQWREEKGLDALAAKGGQ